jgi:pilus assembly protein CpaC
MHHTIFMSRFPVWRLASTFVLLVSTLALSARAQQDGSPPPTTIVVPLNTTKLVEMSKKQPIKEVRSDNPGVVSIAVESSPRSALITARNTGTTRIFLIDAQGNEEFADITVPTDAEQKRQEVLKIVRRTVPTANIDLAMSGPKVIVSGTVGSAESIQVISELVGTQFGGAGNVVNAMRVAGVQQVALDVIVAAVDRSEARTLGFNFFHSGAKYTFQNTLGSLLTFPIGGSATVSPATNLVLSHINGNHDYLGVLEALQGENVLKILSKPTLTTLSGKPANITSGGQTPTVATSNAGATVTYIPFGTVVNFLPIVMGDGKIHLEVTAEVKDLDSNADLIIAGQNPAGAKGFSTRSAQVTVQMEDGQTVAIGGLIQNKVTGGVVKLPILGSLPCIGPLFRTVTYSEREEEMLILVTPRLVHPFHCSDWPKYLPGQETRSPDDFELFLEGILEAPRGQRHPYVGGRYVPAHKTGPTSVIYPCGDGRCSPTGHHHGTSQAPVIPVSQPAAPPPVQATPARMTQTRAQPRTLPLIPATQPVPQPTSSVRRFDVPANPRAIDEREEMERPSSLPDVPTPPALGPVGVGEGPGEAQENGNLVVPVPEPQEGPQ